MKFLLLIFFKLIVISGIIGQDLAPRDVPEKVRSAFESRYPDTYVYEWEYKRKSGFYEAEFMYKGIRHEACFTDEGVWIATEKELKKSDLPEAVLNALEKSAYGDWKVDEVTMHESEKIPVVYEIEVKKGKRELDLYFFPDGKLMQVKK